MSDKAKAISILAASAPSADEAGLQKSAIEQLAKIRALEGEAALRAVFAGIALYLVRLRFPKKGGKWEPWLADNAGEVGTRQARYYMKLALVFIAKQRAAATDIAALHSDKGELSVSGDHALAKKALEFVGELSLNELLEKHGVKKRGARGVDDGDDETEDGGDTTTTTTKAEEQLVFTEMSEHLFGLRQTILKPENLLRLKPKQLDALKAELDATRTEFAKLYKQARKGK